MTSYSSIACASDMDKYVIYALDSIITARAREPLPEALCCAAQCGLRLHRTGSEATIEPGNGVSTLSQWREQAKCYARCIAEEALGGGKVDVVVSTAMGRLGWTYAGSFPDLIASELLRGLWSSMSSAVSGAKQLEIVLDVTHGVNFMPVLAYQVVRHVAAFLVMSGLDRVLIRVHNAVPVPQQSASGMRSYEYFKVFHETLDYVYVPREASDESRIAKAIMVGAIPVLYRLCSKRGGSPTGLAVEADVDRASRTVSYKFSGTAKLGSHVSSIVEEVACREATNSLKRLQQLHIVSKLMPPARDLLISELNTIWHAMESLGGRVAKDSILYSELLSLRFGQELGREDGRCGCEDEKDLRNFVAHAGLLKNCVSIRVCGGGHYLVEVPEELVECLDRLK